MPFGSGCSARSFLAASLLYLPQAGVLLIAGEQEEIAKRSALNKQVGELGRKIQRSDFHCAGIS